MLCENVTIIDCSEVAFQNGNLQSRCLVPYYHLHGAAVGTQEITARHWMLLVQRVTPTLYYTCWCMSECDNPIISAHVLDRH